MSVGAISTSLYSPAGKREAARVGPEALRGAVIVPLLWLQQAVQVAGPTVLRDIVAKLSVGIEAGALHEAVGLQRVREQVLGAVVVSDPEGYLDGLRVDEARSARQGNAGHSARGGREGREAGRVVSDIGSRHHVGYIAGAHAIVEALHQLVVDSVRHNLHLLVPSFRSSSGLGLLERLAPELREGGFELRPLGRVAALPPHLRRRLRLRLLVGVLCGHVRDHGLHYPGLPHRGPVLGGALLHVV